MGSETNFSDCPKCGKKTRGIGHDQSVTYTEAGGAAGMCSPPENLIRLAASAGNPIRGSLLFVHDIFEVSRSMAEHFLGCDSPPELVVRIAEMIQREIVARGGPFDL